MQAAHFSVSFTIDGGLVAHHAETIGIAPTHLILRSSVPLVDGMRLSLKLPIHLDMDAQSAELELFGWVVDASTLPDRHFGAQVELERD